jgi:hypothetical protein
MVAWNAMAGQRVEGIMSIALHTPMAELERSGREYGEDLAAALVLASRRAGAANDLKRQMAKIVLREISAAVDTLRGASVPANLLAAYELACRAGVRGELERSLAAGAQAARHAA